jgi:hypothetical protein
VGERFLGEPMGEVVRASVGDAAKPRHHRPARRSSRGKR